MATSVEKERKAMRERAETLKLIKELKIDIQEIKESMAQKCGAKKPKVNKGERV